MMRCACIDWECGCAWRQRGPKSRSGGSFGMSAGSVGLEGSDIDKRWRCRLESWLGALGGSAPGQVFWRPVGGSACSGPTAGSKVAQQCGPDSDSARSRTKLALARAFFARKHRLPRKKRGARGTNLPMSSSLGRQFWSESPGDLVAGVRPAPRRPPDQPSEGAQKSWPPNRSQTQSSPRKK